MEVKLTRLQSLRRPISRADVVVGLSIGPSFFAGKARTGQDGRAIVTIPISRAAAPRPATADAYALKTLIDDSPRALIYEYGFTRREGLFQILD